MNKNKLERVKVLEVDQFTAAGNIDDYNFKTFQLDKIEGESARGARAIFGGYARIKEVNKIEAPRKGYIWFIEDEELEKFIVWKTNYDSSD